MYGHVEVTRRETTVKIALTTVAFFVLAVLLSAQTDAIRTKCAAEWPTDFSMRVYCEKKQTEAVGQLRQRPMSSENERMIRTKCSADWPTDYSMRDYCEAKQLESLRLLSAASSPPAAKTVHEGPTVSTLIEKTEAEVRTAIGEPREVAGARWTFTTDDDGDEQDLKVYFDKGKVSDVRPSTVALSIVKRRTKPPTGDAAGEPPKPTVPSDAVARCGNGGFVYVSTGDNTCKGFGGVAEWFKKPK